MEGHAVRAHDHENIDFQNLPPKYEPPQRFGFTEGMAGGSRATADMYENITSTKGFNRKKFGELNNPGDGVGSLMTDVEGIALHS